MGCDPETRYDQDTLVETGSKIAASQSMLFAYYGNDATLRDTWLRDPHANNQALVNKIARAIVWQDTFVIATMGSSVTVGTDNCRFDNYPQQLQRFLSPHFAQAGIKLEIRNSAQGGLCGDSHRNQVWCIGNLSGEDLDVVHYSWTYFEAGDPNREQAHELFYRWSLMQSGSPVPQLLYANECSRFSDKDQSLLDQYQKFGANVLCMTRGLAKRGYRKEKGAIGDGIHTTTRYGEGLKSDDPRRQSLGVVFRNWHPGPLLYQTTSDALAYSYLEAMRKAIVEIKNTAYPEQRWPRKRQQHMPTDLPPVMACSDPWCKTAALPVCLTYSQPQFGTSRIKQLPSEEWRLSMTPVENRIPEGDKGTQHCAFEQQCGGLKTVGNTPLSFRLPPLENGLIAICCSRKKCGSILKDAKPVFTIDGHPITNEATIMSADKCLMIRDEFPHSESGSRILTIRLPEGNNVPPISHILGI